MSSMSLKWKLLPLLLIVFILTVANLWLGSENYLRKSPVEIKVIQNVSSIQIPATDDPRLIEEIRNRLVPPSTSPLRLDNSPGEIPSSNPSAGQVQAVERPSLCGAYNGFVGSNTFWLEQTLGWSGLLIEADPSHFESIVNMSRKSWAGHFCLSNSTRPSKLPFFLSNDGGQAGGLIKSPKWSVPVSITIQCYPFYSILLAINRTTIDFLSLDVEGSELDILRTIPFDLVNIKVMTVEHFLLKGGKEELRNFLESKGYIFYRTAGLGDSIFIHPLFVILTEKEKKYLGMKTKQLKPVPRI